MELFIGIAGGLGLFLFGMNMMGTGLQKVAGSRLKRFVEILTNNKIMGVIVGTIVTMLIQSSSATTVMVVGFVNAGIMNLMQAVGVIMGANVGTTITGQLVAFKLDEIAPLVIGIGVLLWFITSKKKHKEIAEVLIGFGILFLGMGMMGDVLKSLKDSPIFRDMMLGLNNPVIGMGVGLAITAILQSSSASTGILIALANEGLITLDLAFPILLGQNIGTCITAMLSSIGANKTAKQAAVVHLLFNVIGSTLFLIVFLIPGIPMTEWIISLSPGEIGRQIANGHTIFNVVNVIVMLPFAGILVKIAERFKFGKTSNDEPGLKYLDARILETPSIAIVMAKKEVLRMGKIVNENLKRSQEAYFERNEKKIAKVFEVERQINDLEHDISQYISNLLNLPLSDEEHGIIKVLINTITDMERVGDHADNIAEWAQYAIDNNVKNSPKAMSELDMMFEKVRNIYRDSLSVYKTLDIYLAAKIIEKDKEIDKMEKLYRARHIERLNAKECNTTAGIVFLDLISNLERIGDHATNISESIIEIAES